MLVRSVFVVFIGGRMSQDNDGEKLVLFGEEVNTSSIIGVFKEHWQLMILIVCLVLFGFGVGLHVGFNNCLVECNTFIFENCDYGVVVNGYDNFDNLSLPLGDVLNES